MSYSAVFPFVLFSFYFPFPLFLFLSYLPSLSLLFPSHFPFPFIFGFLSVCFPFTFLLFTFTFGFIYPFLSLSSFSDLTSTLITVDGGASLGFNGLRVGKEECVIMSYRLQYGTLNKPIKNKQTPTKFPACHSILAKTKQTRPIQ